MRWPRTCSLALRERWWILGLSSAAFVACTVTGSVGADFVGGGGGTSNGVSISSASGVVTMSTIDKVDVLLGIDNTPAMADKEQVLSSAISDLMGALTNPPCVDALGQPVPGQPTSAEGTCPDGSARQFAPIRDVHIGVVSSSLGGHGADACPDVETKSCPGGAANTSADDHGRLVTRTDPCGGPVATTYQGEGFLAWDPQASYTPPGLGNLTDLTLGVSGLVLGAGEIGCRYPSQLESWYRFLADPDPYASIDADGGLVERTGVDAILMAQRQEFLRPDSLLVILMLSDQDDCSIQESGQFFQVAQLTDPADASKPFHLPSARAVCATSPNDPCCLSCAATAPASCKPDPTCAASPSLDDQTDDPNLRCWNEKRRFGVDYLYGTDRYVNALTSVMVPNRAGEPVPNPIFSYIAPDDGAKIRDPSMVILGGIVGVPWQDLARDPQDLTQGFKDAAELDDTSAGYSTWDVILGDPANDVSPLDPHMIASTSPRSGADPITGTSIAPPGSPSGTDPISGYEYTQATPSDLEYACIFSLPTQRDCTNPALPSCDCTDPQNDNPLCEPDPTKNNQRTLQVRAKAYPGLRQLSVLRGLGVQGVVSSICAAQQSDPTGLDYGYRPAIRALMERVGQRLGQ